MRNIKPEVAARVTKFLNRLAKELPAAGKEKVHEAVRRIAELEGTSVNYYKKIMNINGLLILNLLNN